MNMNNNDEIISGGQAINNAFAFLGRTNKDVMLFAEGVDDPSAIFGTTKNLSDIYGKNRLIEMPIAENGLCGIAIGSAMSGKRPIISFHRVEFALLAMEQIINNAAKMHYISNGKHKCPLVLRLVVGRGWGQGPEHSQSLETLFSYIPGLKVLMPTFPNDYKDAIISSTLDDNPTIIIEHRWTHYIKGIVKNPEIGNKIDDPSCLINGDDLTLISSSYSTIEALKAVEILKQVSVNVELFDLRALRPLKLDKIFKSVEKTGKIMTVDTGFKTLGIGSEIVSSVAEKCFESMRTPPKRLGLPDHPTPSSRGYIPNYYPDAHMIIKNISAQLNLSESIQSKAYEILSKAKSTMSIDIPDPSFQGPF